LSRALPEQETPALELGLELETYLAHACSRVRRLPSQAQDAINALQGRRREDKSCCFYFYSHKRARRRVMVELSSQDRRGFAALLSCSSHITSRPILSCRLARRQGKWASHYAGRYIERAGRFGSTPPPSAASVGGGLFGSFLGPGSASLDDAWTIMGV
jgi:hypothetical protein